MIAFDTVNVLITGAFFAFGITESQEKLPTFYWLPTLQKRPYNARFIANSSSCTTTSLSKVLTSCFTAIKIIGLNIVKKLMKGKE